MRRRLRPAPGSTRVRAAMPTLGTIRALPPTQIAIALPRGRDPRAALQSWPEPYLVTQSITAYAAPSETPYITDRVAHVTSYEIAGERARNVTQLRDALLAGALTRTVI